MKKIIPYLLLFGLLYGGWYYWQQLPRPPLVANLLPYETKQIERVEIHSADGEGFVLSLSEADWIVESENRSLGGAKAKAIQLIEGLLALRSSGLAGSLELEAAQVQILLIGPEVSERLQFYAPPDSFPKRSWLVRLNKIEDIYLVEDFSLLRLPIRFTDFRDRQLIDLMKLSRLDSVVWWSAQDSTRTVLLDGTTDDSLRLDSLHQAWSPRKETRFADFFGEIQHAGQLTGQYLIYDQQDSIPTTIEVYSDDRWPLPFVLKGSGQEYFAVDSSWFLGLGTMRQK